MKGYQGREIIGESVKVYLSQNKNQKNSVFRRYDYPQLYCYSKNKRQYRTL